MQAQDIDQEVKERAISCMGQIVAHLGDSLQQVSSEVERDIWHIFHDIATLEF